jgi:hypothetical protein
MCSLVYITVIQGKYGHNEHQLMSLDNHADLLSDVMVGDNGNGTGSFIVDIAHACVLIGSGILIIFGGVVPYVFQVINRRGDFSRW